MLLGTRESLRLGALALAHAAGYLDEKSSQFETLANSYSHFRIGFSLTPIPSHSANESLEPKCRTLRLTTNTVLICPDAELDRSIPKPNVEMATSFPNLIQLVSRRRRSESHEITFPENTDDPFGWPDAVAVRVVLLGAVRCERIERLLPALRDSRHEAAKLLCSKHSRTKARWPTLLLRPRLHSGSRFD